MPLPAVTLTGDVRPGQGGVQTLSRQRSRGARAEPTAAALLRVLGRDRDDCHVS
jgi:hypothetical protein